MLVFSIIISLPSAKPLSSQDLKFQIAMDVQGQFTELMALLQPSLLMEETITPSENEVMTFRHFLKRWFKARKCLEKQCKVKAKSYSVHLVHDTESDDLFLYNTADMHCTSVQELADKCMLNLCRLDFIYFKKLYTLYSMIGASDAPQYYENDGIEVPELMVTECKFLDSPPYISIAESVDTEQLKKRRRSRINKVNADNDDARNYINWLVQANQIFHEEHSAKMYPSQI